MSEKTPARLTRAEEEVMQLIWKQAEPVTVSEMINQLPEPRPPHSTISSLVRILEKKGFVGHRAYGRTYVYFPLVELKDYKLFSISGLVRNYFKGSMNDLVSFLVKENNISLKEISEMVRKIEDESEPDNNQSS